MAIVMMGEVGGGLETRRASRTICLLTANHSKMSRTKIGCLCEMYSLSKVGWPFKSSLDYSIPRRRG